MSESLIKDREACTRFLRAAINAALDQGNPFMAKRFMSLLESIATVENFLSNKDGKALHD